MNLKLRLKKFFKAETASDEAVELLRMFILPFARASRRSGVDEVLQGFFGTNAREIGYIKALRDFKLPGKYFVTGNRPVYGLGPRAIKKGQVLLLALDRGTSQARVQTHDDPPHCYLLERFEFETIKDWVNVIK